VKEEKIAILEMGISQIVPEIIYDLKKYFNIKDVSYLISLHSHFDHFGGCPRLKKFFPKAKLVAEKNTLEVFKEENIKIYSKTMEKINENTLFFVLHPNSDKEVIFEKVNIDIFPYEGFELELGKNLSLKFLLTPGHSPCSISIFEKNSKTLFISDAAGALLPSGKIWPTSFQSFSLYKESIKKIMKMAPEIIATGHIGFLKKPQEYLEKSLKETENFFEYLKELFQKFPEEEEIHKILFKEYQNDLTTYIQPNIFKYGNREMLRQIKNLV
jgi:glyoxylase-like metal-dependent hydrolase (beta-lactamase superfamily II)